MNLWITARAKSVPQTCFPHSSATGESPRIFKKVMWFVVNGDVDSRVEHVSRCMHMDMDIWEILYCRQQQHQIVQQAPQFFQQVAYVPAPLPIASFVEVRPVQSCISFIQYQQTSPVYTVRNPLNHLLINVWVISRSGNQFRCFVFNRRQKDKSPFTYEDLP